MTMHFMITGFIHVPMTAQKISILILILNFASNALITVSNAKIKIIAFVVKKGTM